MNDKNASSGFPVSVDDPGQKSHRLFHAHTVQINGQIVQFTGSGLFHRNKEPDALKKNGDASGMSIRITRQLPADACV